MNTKDFSICLRDFEERDIEFIMKCKNDKTLNDMIVGSSHLFTFADAKKWVEGCMGYHETYKFWAICTNDEYKRIVGWEGLSNIDKDNSSACHHGLVIGDNSYRDGTAMFESMLLSMDYAFNTLAVHRLYGGCLSTHKTTPAMLNSLGFSLEGIRRDAVKKNGNYCDLLDYALLDNEFMQFEKEGQYDIDCLIVSFIDNIRKRKRINK